MVRMTDDYEVPMLPMLATVMMRKMTEQADNSWNRDGTGKES